MYDLTAGWFGSSIKLSYLGSTYAVLPIAKFSLKVSVLY